LNFASILDSIAGLISWFTGRLIDNKALDFFNARFKESPLQITKAELLEEICLLYKKAGSVAKTPNFELIISNYFL